MCVMVLGLGFAVGYALRFGKALTPAKGDKGNSESDRLSAEDAMEAAQTIPDKGTGTQIVLSQDRIQVTGSGAAAEGSTVRIEKGGTYHVTGTLTNGQIYIKTGDDENVILVLEGMSITNLAEPAIYADNTGSLTIYLAEDSENHITSGTQKEICLDAADGEASMGAIYLRDDAVICGEGKLIIEGYINNGIQCSNNLYIESGELEVSAVNHGIKGKDSLTIEGGSVNVLAGGDGLRSDDDTGEGYGVICINGGRIQVESYQDAVQAETALTVSGGILTIKTNGEISKSTSTAFGRGKSDFKWDLDSIGSGSDASTKGLKSGGDLEITGGEILVESVDDAIHSNGTILISGGIMTLSTKDDGIHADVSLQVDEGIIDILESYEGLEANAVTINGGQISAVSSDDGLNAGGNSAGTGNSLPQLTINGGTVYVNARGDGLDSNGDLTINGGLVIVDGPSNSSNGALDSGTENGGKLLVNGGTVLAVGASGMAESFSEASGQCSFHAVTGTFGEGSVIAVYTADGTELISHETHTSGTSVVFSCEALEIGQTYILIVDGVEQEILQESVSTGNRGGMGGFGPGGMFGRPNGGRNDGTGAVGKGEKPSKDRGDLEKNPPTGEEGTGNFEGFGGFGDMVPPAGQEGSEDFEGFGGFRGMMPPAGQEGTEDYEGFDGFGGMMPPVGQEGTGDYESYGGFGDMVPPMSQSGPGRN